MPQFVSSSQAYRTLNNDVANKGVQPKRISDQQFWKYNTINEKGMLSNLHSHIFVGYKHLACILNLQMQEHITNNIQMNCFVDICGFGKEKANAF